MQFRRTSFIQRSRKDRPKDQFTISCCLYISFTTSSVEKPQKWCYPFYSSWMILTFILLAFYIFFCIFYLFSSSMTIPKPHRLLFSLMKWDFEVIFLYKRKTSFWTRAMDIERQKYLYKLSFELFSLFYSENKE